MRNVVLLALLALAVIAPVQATNDLPPAIDRLLQGIRAADKGQLAVSEEDGRFLRVLIASDRRQSACSKSAPPAATAPSGWGSGCGRRAAQLVTIEYDPVRANEAAEPIFERAGLGDVVRVISGDAFKEIPETPGRFRSRFPRRVEARLQKVLRHCLSARHAWRFVPRSQRDQQKERDARLSLGHRRASSGLEHHRLAGPRGNFDDIQETVSVGSVDQVISDQKVARCLIGNWYGVAMPL